MRYFRSNCASVTSPSTLLHIQVPFKNKNLLLILLQLCMDRRITGFFFRFVLWSVLLNFGVIPATSVIYSYLRTLV